MSNPPASASWVAGIAGMSSVELQEEVDVSNIYDLTVAHKLCINYLICQKHGIEKWYKWCHKKITGLIHKVGLYRCPLAWLLSGP